MTSKPTYEELIHRVGELERASLERETTKQKLRESDERYRNLLANTHDVIYSVDGEGVFTYVSPPVERLTGFRPDEYVGRSFFDFIWPEDEPHFTAINPGVLTGKIHSIEARIKRREGGPCRVYATMNPIVIDSSIVEIHGVVTDVTERHRAMEALRKSEEKFKTIFENAYDEIAYFDMNGNIIDVNDRVEDIFGWKRRECVGGNYLDLEVLDDEGNRRCSELIMGLLSGTTEENTIEIDASRQDGSRITVEANARIIKKDGKPGGIVVIIRDITERKQTEKDLKESERKYRLLIDSLDHPVTVYDTEGRVLLMNPAATKPFGMTPEQVIGSSLFSLFPGKAYEFVGYAAEVIESGIGIQTEDEVPMPDGPHWFLCDIRPVKDETDKPIAVQSISYDFTERVNAERAIRELDAKWRTLAEHAPLIIMIISRDGTIEFLNRTAEGVTVEEATGASIDTYVLPEYREITRSSIRHVFDTGQVAAYEAQAGDAQQHNVKWYQVNMGPVMQNGEVVAVDMICTDITERKQTEERWLHFLNSAADWYVILDSSLDVVELNDTWFTTFFPETTAKEEIIGRNFADIVPGFRQSGRYDRFMAVLQTGAPHTEKDVLLKAEAANRFFHINIRVIKIGNTLCAIATDITERKLADEALRKSEEQLRLIAENITDVIVIRDMELNPIYISPSVERFRGYTVEEMMDLPLDKLFTPESMEKAITMLAEGLERERAGNGDPSEIHTLEAETYNKDGSKVWTEFQTRFLRDESGNAVSILAVVHDITQRKMVEEELRKHRDQLEELVKERTASREDANTALKVLLKRRDEEKEDLQENVMVNVKELVVPFLNELKKTDLNIRQEGIVQVVQDNLNDVVSPFVKRLSSSLLGFTPAEIRITNLLKQGLTTKEIADVLDISAKTVDRHRANIREKLGIRNKKGNLATHLLPLLS